MTFIEAQLFGYIKPNEMYRCAWMKKKANELSPNLLKMTHRFNLVSYWVCTEIITTAHPDKRNNILCRFIRLMELLLEMNNFQG